MTDIAAVKTSRDERSDEIVRLLEEALAAAKERPCDGLTITLSFCDGQARTLHNSEDKFRLLGLLDYQKSCLLRDPL